MTPLKERVESTVRELLLAQAADAVELDSEATVAALTGEHTARMLKAAQEAESGAVGRVAEEAHHSYMAVMWLLAALLERLRLHGEDPLDALLDIVGGMD